MLGEGFLANVWEARGTCLGGCWTFVGRLLDMFGTFGDPVEDPFGTCLGGLWAGVGFSEHFWQVPGKFSKHSGEVFANVFETILEIK